MRVGTSYQTEYQAEYKRDHPHACGDKVAAVGIQSRITGSSPCVWGQVETSFLLFSIARIIPMRVGTSLGQPTG